MPSIFRRKSDGDMIGDTRPSWHLHRYLQGSANLFEENRLLKVAIGGMFGITAILGTVLYTSNQNQRTVIVPWVSKAASTKREMSPTRISTRRSWRAICPCSTLVSASPYASRRKWAPNRDHSPPTKRFGLN